MTAAILLWVLLPAIAGCGSAYSAVRDPPSTSRMKIAVAGVLLLAFLLALGGSRRIGSDVIGEGLFAHAMLFVILPMATIGGATLPWLGDWNARRNVPRQKSLYVLVLPNDCRPLALS
jgi:hypothetical protein